MSGDLVEIKGEMTLLSVLRLASAEMETIRQGLQHKLESVPQLFANSPLVVDCSRLGETCEHWIWRSCVTPLWNLVSFRSDTQYHRGMC